MDREKLVEAHCRLLQRHTVEERRTAELRATTRRLNNSLIESNEVERRLLELKHAQAAHNAFAATLQKQLLEAQTFKSACRRHETAISQLEDTLARIKARVSFHRVAERKQRIRSKLHRPFHSPFEEFCVF